MNIEDIKISADDLKGTFFERLLTNTREKDCEQYGGVLQAEAKKIGDENNKGWQALMLLAGICSYHFTPDDARVPFKPMYVFPPNRGVIPDDLTGGQLDVFGLICPEIKDPELRARMADVLWLRGRGHTFAQLAIDSYLESAEALKDSEFWVTPLFRIERALRLSLLLGRGNPYIVKVLAVVEEWIRRYSPTDVSFRVEKLVRLLYDFDRPSSIKYADVIRDIADKLSGAGDQYSEEIFFALEGKLRLAANDQVGYVNAILRQAEAYFEKARKHEAGGLDGYLAAAWNVEQGIQVLRTGGRPKTEIEEKMRWLHELQAKGMGQMKTVEIGSQDVTDTALASIAKIKGKNLVDALLTLAVLAASPKVDELRRLAEKTSRDMPLRGLVTRDLLNGEGKRIAQSGDIKSKDPKEQEDAWLKEMHDYANWFMRVSVMATILPAREAIVSEHPVQAADLVPLLVNHPFIPAGRIGIYAKGLLAGLYGNFLEAVHLLVPQIENSLRYVLRQQGVVTTSLNRDGIQEEFLLDKLLGLPELRSILGENLIFDLRGLLVERFGSNLRNNVAHGLLDEEAFNSVEGCYCWWLTLRIICLPHVVARHKRTKHTNESEGDPKQEPQPEILK